MGLGLAEKGVNLVVYRAPGIVRDYTGSESILLGFFAAAFILVSVFPYEKVGVWTPEAECIAPTKPPSMCSNLGAAH